MMKICIFSLINVFQLHLCSVRVKETYSKAEVKIKVSVKKKKKSVCNSTTFNCPFFIQKSMEIINDNFREPIDKFFKTKFLCHTLGKTSLTLKTITYPSLKCSPKCFFFFCYLSKFQLYDWLVSEDWISGL